MRTWAMWEVFPEYFASGVNPFATSSVIFTRKAPVLRMEKLADSMVLRKLGLLKSVSSLYMKWFLCVKNMSSVSGFFLTSPWSQGREILGIAGARAASVARLSMAELDKRCILHMPGLMQQACNPMRMKWACLGYRPSLDNLARPCLKTRNKKGSREGRAAP